MTKRPRKPPIPSATRLRPMYQRTFIRQWREKRELSQEELADGVGEYLAERDLATGYTHATIGRLERGLVRYTQPVMEAIAHVLNVTVSELIAVDPTDPHFDEASHERQMRSIGHEMANLWSQADEDDRRKLVEIGRTLIRPTR